jgi:type IV pilus assembly protein PilC
MVQFSYTAIDSRGKATKGTLQVTTQPDALTRLRELGLHPLKVTRVEEGPKGLPKPASVPRQRVWQRGFKLRQLAANTRQLATLLRAGLPLLRGLRILEEQETNPQLKLAIRAVAGDIEGGSTFAEALARQPRVFNRLYVNMAKAGETGGVLETVLLRLAEFMEKAERIKRKVISAMFYPVAVLVVASAILLLLLLWVVPRFKLVYLDMLGRDAVLPQFTRLVLGISEAILYNLPAAGVAAVGLAVAWRVYVGTRAGRYLVDRWKLRMPVFGPVISKVAISRFTRTLGTLVSSGVPILQALTIVKETAGNAVLAGAVGSVHERVKEGETMTAPLAASGVFPLAVISMVDVGEKTGALPEMLLTIANDYDDEVDNAVAAMTSLLEPILIVLLAVVVGSIVIALFLPIIDIISRFGNGSEET